MNEINGRNWLIGTFDRFGIKYPLTDKGNPSFKRGKRGWMQYSEHWLPPLIAAADQLDQYGDNFLQQQILEHIENGRVYGEIHPHRSDQGGTRSLRFSYSHPPLQQMPKHDEELAPLIRSVFLPEDGEAWASADYNQQEFRHVVHFAARHKLAGAAAARDRYINDPSFDIHAYASELTGGMISRQDGKTFNFMTIYGAGPETTSHQVKKSLSETKALLALYNEKMPFISQLATACKNAAHRDGYFRLFNRARRHFNLWAPGGQYEEGAGPCAREEAERRAHDPGHPWYGRRLWRAETYKALNVLIQSSAAIQTKLWMRDCFREGVIPLLQMHDSLDLSVTSPEQAEMVARLGEEVIKLEVPMKVDVKYGHTWGDATHTWAQLHTETSSHIELTEELPNNRERTTREDAKFSSVSDEAPDFAPAEETELRPWKPAASALEPPHICIHCKLDPADGTERTIADDTWLHPRCEDAYINARMAQEGLVVEARQTSPPQTPPPPSPQSSQTPSQSKEPSSGGNGAWREHGSKTAAERNTYAEEHAGEPFNDAYLLKQGYKLVRVFDYTLANRARLYQHNRYELKKGYTPSKKRERKQFLTHRSVNDNDVFGAGDRRVIYNWPAIMVAGPGSTVFVCEGEANAEALIKAGLLATTVLSHKWASECISALAGYHLIILEDYDDEGKALSADAHRKLSSIAASTRIIPALHLWKHLPGGKEPTIGDDVEDWIKLGGDLKALLDICRKIPADGIFTAEPYKFCNQQDISPWEWLYGRHLLRGEVAGTAAMGGTGKSTTSIVEALAQASGRALLGEQVPRPLRVVLINLEDSRNTMDKRIAAAMEQHKLTATDIGDRLIVKAKGEIKIKVAKQRRNGDVDRNEQTIQALIRLMQEHRADVFSIDSFIRTHKVNENDNSAIQEVVECFEDVAGAAQCAGHLWHHTRKAGGERATVESARGAIAFIDACRSARIMETMAEKEHEQLIEIQPEMAPRGFYFRMFNGKRNFAPPADQSDWFKLENIALLNGDEVGAVTTWRYPGTWDDVAPEVAERAITEIGQGMPNGQRFSNDNAATKRAAWPIVQKHCPNKTQDQCRRMVSIWLKRDLLYTDSYPDPVYNKQQVGLFARSTTVDEKEDES